MFRLMLTILLALFVGIPFAIAFDDTVIMPFQGYLADISGNPVADGDYTMVFAIYDDSTMGNALWTETHTVAVTNGGFSVTLGSDEPMVDTTLWEYDSGDADRWIGVTVGTDSEMSPRTRLGSTPYAGVSNGVKGHIRTGIGQVSLPDTAGSQLNFIANNHMTSIGFIVDTSEDHQNIVLNADTGGSSLVLENLADVSFDTTLIYMTVDVTKSSLTLGYDIGDADFDGSLVLASDSSGGSIGYDIGDADKPVFGLFGHQSGGGMIIRYDIGDAEFDTACFLHSGFGGGELNLYDIGDAEHSVLNAGELSFHNGMKALTAGLSSNGLTLKSGAADGYVLTSDATGTGTWQPNTGGGSSCWLCPGNYTYLDDIDDSVGIGTDTPSEKLEVSGKIKATGFDINGSVGTPANISGTSTGYNNPTLLVENTANGCAARFHSGTGSWQSSSYQYAIWAQAFDYSHGVRIDSENGWPLIIQQNGDNACVLAFVDGSGDVFYGNAETNTGSLLNLTKDTLGGYKERCKIEKTGDMMLSGDMDISGTLSKGAGSFKIDHPLDPENKYLYHSFVESPDMMNVYNGNIDLDENGEAKVILPDYFEALNRDFRYQLTCVGEYAPVFIAETINNNKFKIAGGKPGLTVSWQVTGVRIDAFAEANRIKVEVDKPDEEKGKWLHPDIFGLGVEYNMHYKEYENKSGAIDERSDEK